MASAFAIIFEDGLFKVIVNDQPLRIKSKSGKAIAVEFETNQAAEGFVRAQELLRAFDQLEGDE